MLFAVISTAFAQVPRGETGESMADQYSDGPLFLFVIIALIAIVSGFKESPDKGMKALGICGVAALFYWVFPAAAAMIIGVAGLIFAYALIRSFWG